MKNFPHQINKIPRLVKALVVFGNLIDSDQYINDDGIVGDALARAGVYTFRGNDHSIEELLEIEHRKVRGAQGTRTCARDLRRFFRMVGFLTEDMTLSEEAKLLIEMQDDPLNLEARRIWSTSLKEMVLEDDGGSSHPYRILLRLVRDNPGIMSSHLGLCLEANNDTEGEYQRIDDLVTSSVDIEGIAEATENSLYKLRNSAKILPALARQLGDILESDDGYHINQPSVTYLPAEPTSIDTARATRTRRRFNPDQEQIRPSDYYEQDRTIQRTYDPDQTDRRYRAHQECLLTFSRLVPNALEQYEDDYDLLVVGEQDVLVIEVKTIRGDEAKQVRLALGQVLYYEHIFIEPMYPDHIIDRLVVIDTEPSSDIIDFLGKFVIGVVWLPLDQQSGQSDLAESVLSKYNINL